MLGDDREARFGERVAQRMGLTSGTKLGPYEIVSPLGAGGMGEVYRARDTRLDRTDAIISDAATPLPTTSAMTMPSRPSGSSMKS